MRGAVDTKYECNDCGYVLEEWEMKYTCPSCKSEDIAPVEDAED